PSPLFTPPRPGGVLLQGPLTQVAPAPSGGGAAVAAAAAAATFFPSLGRSSTQASATGVGVRAPRLHPRVRDDAARLAMLVLPAGMEDVQAVFAGLTGGVEARDMPPPPAWAGPVRRAKGRGEGLGSAWALQGDATLAALGHLTKAAVLQIPVMLTFPPGQPGRTEFLHLSDITRMQDEEALGQAGHFSLQTRGSGVEQRFRARTSVEYEEW
ncbi:hypothetical protein HK405_000718, partial [Cladochytrium tenue]